MRNRILGFILFIIFLIIFYSGVKKVINVSLLGIRHIEVSEKSEFINKIKDLIKNINKIKEYDTKVTKKRKVYKPNLKIFYTIVSPKKQVGLYYRGENYLLKEGENITSNIKVKKIMDNQIYVTFKDKTYSYKK